LMNTSSSTASAGISGTLASSQSMSSSTTSCLFDFPDIHVQSAAASTADLSDQTVHSTVLSEYLYVPTQGDSSRPVTTSGAASVQHHSIIERILPKIFSPNANVAEQSSTAVLQANPVAILRDVSRSSSTPRLDALSTSARSSPVRHDTALVNPHNDYLVQAAQFISTAQKAENERAFELAFHCYKSAVSALLQGVQYERDLSRRNAVRKKTAKYLLKAEKLYRSYLSFDGSAFDVNSWLSNTVHDPNLIAFQMSNAALKSYRIVGILPSASAKHRVLLVEERNAGSEMRYVMKLLEKSANVWCSRQQRTPASSCTIVPMHIANMVQLHKFFDIDNFIILLLEYVKHGTLWDFLEDYFEECGRKIRIFMETEIFKNDFRDCELRDKTTPSAKGGHWDERLVLVTVLPWDAEVASYAPDEVTAGPSSVVNSTGLRTKPNAYEGRHVRFSVGGEGDEPMDLAGESTFDQLLGKHTDKMSVSSWDSGTSLCGASVPIGGEGSASSAHAPFEAVLQGTVTEAAVDCFSLDEEAPAPVNLSTRSATTCAIGDELDLVEALERAKKRLQRGKRWSRNEHLPESLLVHWMAQLVSAVYLLHSQGIVLRDLRPDNLLIDENADLKLTFCSQWHDVDARADESAISECYGAPELLSVTQTIAEAADRWSIGAIMFELVCGQKLAHLCPHGLATAITLPIPDCVDISFAARDLLSRLLLVNPLERLSDDDLRAHPFFSDCDWRVYDGTMPAVKASFQSSNSHIEQVSEAFGVAQGAAEEQQLSCCDYDVPRSVSEPLSPQQLMMIANGENRV
uniref:Protein kinase domain-containing protein n=1 Tax=Toxocara canis TaxID=6265 RepID=A0A183V4J0_TOXCA